jgi:hypothetical protein
MTCFLVSVKQSLADRAKGRADLLKNAATMQLQVVELEQELKQVREMVVADKKKIEDELVEERWKTQEVSSQFSAASIGKINFLRSFSSSLSCAAEDSTSECFLYIANFHRWGDDLKNELKNTKDKVQSLEVNPREIDTSAKEMKRVMKETIDSEFAETQKLAERQRYPWVPIG